MSKNLGVHCPQVCADGWFLHMTIASPSALTATRFCSNVNSEQRSVLAER